MEKESKRETFLMSRTLASLVNALVGTYTVVDMRNNEYATGKIVKTDACMNTEMEDVVFYDQRGTEHYFETFFVNARNIRHIHIPSDISPEEAIRKSWEVRQRKPVKGKKTFKESRSQKYQKSILKDLSQASTSADH